MKIYSHFTIMLLVLIFSNNSSSLAESNSPNKFGNKHNLHQVNKYDKQLSNRTTKSKLSATNNSSSGETDISYGNGNAWTNGLSYNGYSSGNNNTSFGVGANSLNTSGTSNTSIGYNALNSNTIGYVNTAIGSQALQANTIGEGNSATGFDALTLNTSGNNNTANGAQSLYSNSSGNYNTAVGTFSLLNNSDGDANTAIGSSSLRSNTTGNSNTAIGSESLHNNTIGLYNTASGDESLYSNTSGNHNVASGIYSLNQLTTGNRNIAIGAQAGCGLTTSSNNIYIGNRGQNTDNGVIRIGGDGTSISCPDSITLPTQVATYIAGIAGVNIASTDTPVQVYVGTDGQLGIQSSSRRFKERIESLGEDDRLLKLRPVSFRYAGGDPGRARPIQFGLIAEEVAEIMPELVNFDTDGKPFTVNYQFLAPLLLTIVKKDDQEIRRQRELLETLVEQNKMLRDSVAALQQQVRSRRPRRPRRWRRA